MKKISLLAILLLFQFCFVQQLLAKELIIVAGDETLKSAQQWTDFLEDKAIPIKHIQPQDFGQFQKEGLIVIMGSINDQHGIREVAKLVLTADELSWVSQEGNRQMYIKNDVWAPKQTIIVFTGYNLEASESSRVNTKSKWWSQICSYFGIEVDSKDLYGY